MNTVQKIEVLGDAARFDTCASSSSKRKTTTNDRVGNAMSSGICHSFTEDGRCVSLMKVLYSNKCSMDCKYCTNAVGCRKKSATFEPKELAKTFMGLYVRNYVEGLFLSSAVLGEPDRTVEQMIDCVNLIRNKYKFQGYIHFKILPGTSKELIKQAAGFADRLSINLEAPNKSRMAEISSVKDYNIDILRRQAWIKRTELPSGQTTQLVVGSSDETDLEILDMVDWEYENIGLKRAYYSAFVPVPDTPLQGKDKTPLQREVRLYNVDFMVRKYGIGLNEFKQVMNDGMLPREDPKLALARETFDGPVDVNSASYDELLRVPGIGPMGALKIMQLQSSGRMIKKYEELHNMGVVLKRAKPFIKVNGRWQMTLNNFGC